MSEDKQQQPVTPEMLDADARAREGWLRFQDILLDKVTAAEAAAEEARQENEQLRATLNPGGQMFEALAEARQERDAAKRHGNEDRDRWFEKCRGLQTRIQTLEAALRRIANDHNDGRSPDHRWMDWAQDIARAVLQPTPKEVTQDDA